MNRVANYYLMLLLRMLHSTKRDSLTLTGLCGCLSLRKLVEVTALDVLRNQAQNVSETADQDR